MTWKTSASKPRSPEKDVRVGLFLKLKHQYFQTLEYEVHNERSAFQGRRVWLFANNPLGARASANLFSLVSTARANGLDPSAYLTYLFERLPAADTLEALEALLPWNVRNVLRTARRAA